MGTEIHDQLSHQTTSSEAFSDSPLVAPQRWGRLAVSQVRGNVDRLRRPAPNGPTRRRQSRRTYWGTVSIESDQLQCIAAALQTTSLGDHTWWVALPETHYAAVDGIHIAYQVVGDGPFDLLHIPGFVSNVELAWEEPSYEHFLRRLSSFARLITFDKRGTGMSDRLPTDRLPTLEERMDDIHAVLDEVGSERVALLGHSEGGNLSVLFAATYPERTIALVTTGIFATRIWSPDYPWAPTPEQRAHDIEE